MAETADLSAVLPAEESARQQGHTAAIDPASWPS